MLSAMLFLLVAQLHKGCCPPHHLCSAGAMASVYSSYRWGPRRVPQIPGVAFEFVPLMLQLNYAVRCTFLTSSTAALFDMLSAVLFLPVAQLHR